MAKSLTNKKKSKKKRKVNVPINANLFDGGGNIGAPDVAGAINGTLGVISAVSDISTIKDTSGYEDQLKNESTLLQNAANQTFSAGSTEDLMSKFNNATKIGDIEQTESLGMDAIAGSKKENMQTAGRAIGSGASAGAAIGSMFGHLGTAIGAGAGALIGGVSAWFGNNKKKKKAAEKQKQLEAERQKLAIQRQNAANQQIANLAESSTNLQSDMAFNAMANYAAFGGLFNTFNDGGYTGPMYVDPNQVNTRQSFLSTAPTRGQRVKNRLNMIGDAVAAFLPSKEETATNIVTSRFMPKASGKLGVISTLNNLPDTVSKIENLKKAFNLPYSEGLIDAGKGQTFIGNAVKKFAKGGDTEEEIEYKLSPGEVIVDVPVDEYYEEGPAEPQNEEPQNNEGYKPMIFPYTEDNKLLPNESTAETFISARWPIYKANLQGYLGKSIEVTDEMAKKSLNTAIDRMNSTPASIMQYTGDEWTPWKVKSTTDTINSVEDLQTKAKEEEEESIKKKGVLNGFFYANPSEEDLSSPPSLDPDDSNYPFKYASWQKNKLDDPNAFKKRFIEYLNIDPSSPEWEKLTIHERAHAMMLKAAEHAISERMKKAVLREGVEKDEYLDDPKEIFARVKQVQVSQGMDPLKTYSVDELKSILKKSGDDNLLNRYSDEDLDFLFNKVAYNPSNLNIEVPEQMKYTNPSEGVSLAAYGGPLFKEFSNGITIINEGGTHEDNPFEGVQVGVDPQGTPNLVEEGEVIFNDYVFSNRLTVPNKVRSKYKLRNNKKLSFADAAKDIQKMSEEMPNDPIVKRTMELRMNQLMQEQEMVRQKKNEHSGNTFAKGGSKEKFDKASKRASKRFGIDLGEYTEDWQNSDAYKDYLSANKVRNSNLTGLGLQAAPALGSLLAVGNDIFGGNKADLSTVDAYRAAIDNAYKPVGTVKAHTISDYMQYNPYDTSFELNKLNASQAASRNALINTSGGNSAAARAAILASDYNYGNQIGDTYRRAQEYNDANREKVMAFNRGTNQFNAQALDSADARNAQIAQFNAQQDNARAEALFNAGKYRDALIQANRAEKSGNLTGLYEGLAGLGETIYNMGNVKYLQDNKVLVDETGNIKGGNTAAKTTVEVPAYTTPTKEDILKWASEGVYAAKGGKLKRKTKRRRLS